MAVPQDTDSRRFHSKHKRHPVPSVSVSAKEGPCRVHDVMQIRRLLSFSVYRDAVGVLPGTLIPSSLVVDVSDVATNSTVAYPMVVSALYNHTRECDMFSCLWLFARVPMCLLRFPPPVAFGSSTIGNVQNAKAASVAQVGMSSPHETLDVL